MTFLPGATWFSEASLPSPFLQRYRGDRQYETRTKADGVIGHIIVGKEGKTDLTLASGALQIAVVEAKINSRLSQGVKHADYYDQAVRNVACIAEVLRLANVSARDMSRIGFYVLAPGLKIREGAFAKELDHRSIRSKATRRVSEYKGERDKWLSDWFLPLMDQIDIKAISWEKAIDQIEEKDKEAAGDIREFYEKCLKFN